MKRNCLGKKMITRRTRTTSTTTTRMSSTQSEKAFLMTQPITGDSKPITNNSLLAITSVSSKSIATLEPCKSPSTGPDWNTTSLKDVLAISPPHIRSTSSSGSTSSLSSTPTCSPSPNNPSLSRFSVDQTFSTPRKQSFCVGWDCNEDSGMEVDDRTNHSNHFGRLFLSNTLHNYPQGSGSSTFHQEFSSQPITQGTSETSNGGSPDALRRNLMSRPKPYSAFLDEVKQQEFEAEVEAWRRAKEEAVIDRLRMKEALISEWEFRQTSKAVEKMKKYEMKLEKKRSKELEKLQAKIRLTKAEADKKTSKARRETVEKMSKISKISIKARATKNLASLKL